MVLMSAKIQAKTEMGQEQVEVDETVQNHAAPASEPAITNGTASGKPQLESKNALDRIAKDLRDISGEALQEMKKRAERYREKPNEVDELASQVERLQVDDKMALFDKTFQHHPVSVGKAISKRERDETNQKTNSTLVYGEITFNTLAVVLHKIKTVYGRRGVGHSGPQGVLQEPGGAFYDIGAGTGKPVIGAAILHHFDKSVGIEILEGLHATSKEVLKTWETGLIDEVGHEPPTKVSFIRGDALDFEACDWSDADIVFANSTCFDDILMRRLAAAASSLKKGAIFITLTRRLPASSFKVLEHEMYPMSWGSATVYISQKTTDPLRDLRGTE